ncbi:unnamed protein product [Didymodactylos carnosus]|uniref:Uncharacterized protein n=1 Tax=Didymodactylos carnosus TaxID=1234261 RepID=A0A814QGD4_9BILA|nr:unnamed protein product [Didymodactylos carnosus]CAF1118197.1 unnamed protein product [Didymodactylos carnosus]CAF3658972.1 unnamed protein product [Didymodactylos carnosus]CAF3881944.1 unnamed protein product [Didymodactylos carnosus]
MSGGAEARTHDKQWDVSKVNYLMNVNVRALQQGNFVKKPEWHQNVLPLSFMQKELEGSRPSVTPATVKVATNKGNDITQMNTTDFTIENWFTLLFIVAIVGILCLPLFVKKKDPENLKQDQTHSEDEDTTKSTMPQKKKKHTSTIVIQDDHDHNNHHRPYMSSLPNPSDLYPKETNIPHLNNNSQNINLLLSGTLTLIILALIGYLLWSCCSKIFHGRTRKRSQNSFSSHLHGHSGGDTSPSPTLDVSEQFILISAALGRGGGSTEQSGGSHSHSRGLKGAIETEVLIDHFIQPLVDAQFVRILTKQSSGTSILQPLSLLQHHLKYKLQIIATKNVFRIRIAFT